MNSNNYFSILNLPTSFTLDEAILDNNYFNLQFEFHPDRAISNDQKELFAQKVTMLNGAYMALRDDLARAKELLRIAGIDLQMQEAKLALGADELEQILQEAEYIAQTSQGSDLSKALADKYIQKKHIVDELALCFKSNDLEQATKLTVLLKYITNLIDQIKKKLEQKLTS